MRKQQASTHPGIKWEKQLSGVRSALLPSRSSRPNPLVSDEMVYASILSPSAVHAVARDTGELVWKRDLDSYGSSALYLHDQALYATTSRSLYSLNPRTGEIHWQFSPQPDEGEWIYSLPVASAGRVFIGDRSGYLHCLHAKTAQPIWRRQTSRGDNNQVNSTAVIIEDKIIAANNEGAVICYAVDSGKTLWRRRVGKPVGGELLLLKNTVIFAGTSLYALDHITGTVLYERKFPGKTVHSLTLAGLKTVLSLGTDFYERPAAWNDPSAFDDELVIMEGDREITRQMLKHRVSLRTCNETGFVYATSHSMLSVIDPADGSHRMSRRGEIALPHFSNGIFYGLTDSGILFAEPASLD